MAPGRVRVVRSGSRCLPLRPHVLQPARLGALQLETRTRQHTSGVERAVRNTTRNRDGFCHGDDQHQQLSIGGNIWPAPAAPPAVLVTDIGNGSLYLQGQNNEISASLNPPDAMPLSRKLTAAFGRTELAPGQGEAR
jgi:hypothetical protein